jgi:hypothetical protein
MCRRCDDGRHGWQSHSGWADHGIALAALVLLGSMWPGFDRASLGPCGASGGAVRSRLQLADGPLESKPTGGIDGKESPATRRYVMSQWNVDGQP